MIRNYLILAFRNFWKYRGFSTINMLGLALGLAGSLTIYLWVQHELKFDQFHQKKENLHIVASDWTYSDGSTEQRSNTPANLTPILKHNYPEIANVSRIWYDPANQVNLEYEEKSSHAVGLYADASFLEMFSFSLILGNPATTLQDLQSIVITAQLAEQLFPEQEAVGKMAELKDLQGVRSYQVSGVLENIPAQSSFSFDFIIPYQDLENRNDWLRKWGSTSVTTLVEVQEGTHLAALNNKIKDIPLKHYPDLNYVIRLFPFQDVYLHASFTTDLLHNDIRYVYTFSLIALIVLALACFNFVNLSVAQAGKRAREIGVRKVMGAGKRLLFLQFMGEALLSTLLATLLAVAMVYCLLPIFNQYFGTSLALHGQQWQLFVALLCLMLLTTLFSGSYPAFVMAAMKTLNSLKGKMSGRQQDGWLKKGLVTMQFIISIVLIIGALAVNQQLCYLQEKKLGLEKEHVLILPNTPELSRHYEAFRLALLDQSSIIALTRTSENPLQTQNSSDDPWWPGKAEDDNHEFNLAMVDYDYPETLGVSIKSGRSFSREVSADSVNYIINEEAATQMGLEDPIGHELAFWKGKGTIIGVVENFHYRSLHQPIGPLILMLWPENTEQVYVKIKAGNTKEALAAIQETYGQYSAAYPFSYEFLDDSYTQQYAFEAKVEKIAMVFTLLAIIISCMGLLGMVTFSAEQRSKEVGIRKVLGASVVSILLLFFRTYLRLIVLAIAIAIPLSNYFLEEWLSNFAYRIPMQWWLFTLPALVMLILVGFTISSQGLKAALRNPVDCLKDE